MSSIDYSVYVFRLSPAVGSLPLSSAKKYKIRKYRILRNVLSIPRASEPPDSGYSNPENVVPAANRVLKRGPRCKTLFLVEATKGRRRISTRHRTTHCHVGMASRATICMNPTPRAFGCPDSSYHGNIADRRADAHRCWYTRRLGRAAVYGFDTTYGLEGASDNDTPSQTKRRRRVFSRVDYHRGGPVGSHSQYSKTAKMITMPTGRRPDYELFML